MKGTGVSSSCFIDLGMCAENMLPGATPNVCRLNRIRLLHGHGQEKDETQTFIYFS